MPAPARVLRPSGAFRAPTAERREIPRELARIENLTKCQIARTLGVDEKTVRRDTAANAIPGHEQPNADAEEETGQCGKCRTPG